ncbi:MAG: efflux RND transporter periplasmic adaptor subunit [bacterium]
MKSIINERFGRVIKAMWRPVAGLLGLVALVVWSGGLLESKVGPGKSEYQPGVPVTAGSNTKVVKSVMTPSWVEVIGTAASERMVSLSARLPATIETMRVTAGDVVTNGQVLATLDDRDIREQMAAAEAQFQQTEVEGSRTLKLFEKGATTDQARVAALSAFESAKARLQQIRVMLSYTVMVSPIDGVVTDRRMEAGDMAAPGQVILTVYDPRQMRLNVPVPGRLLQKFLLNQTVEVRLDGVEPPVQGRVREIVSEVDPLSRTQMVKIHLAQEGITILPGSYGRIRVEGDLHESVWIPSTAIYRVGQQELVHVVVDGRAIRRVVRSGVTQGAQVEVLAGLTDGEVILLEPVKEG